MVGRVSFKGVLLKNGARVHDEIQRDKSGGIKSPGFAENPALSVWCTIWFGYCFTLLMQHPILGMMLRVQTVTYHLF